MPTAALMALGPLLGGLLLLIMHGLELARRIGKLSGESTRTLTTVRRVESDLYKIEKEIKQTFRQLETMQNLGAMLPANDVLPATRSWAASPDLIAVLGRSGDIRQGRGLRAARPDPHLRSRHPEGQGGSQARVDHVRRNVSEGRLHPKANAS